MVSLAPSAIALAAQSIQERSAEVLMTAKDVALYYDELHKWTQKDASFQVFSGLENDTIHHFLVDAGTGTFSPDTIYTFIDPHIPAGGSARGLDAGCGYGGTCFHALRVHGGHWTGITISQEQWTYANGIAKARGLDGAIDFRLMSYDEALPGRYNVMVAIESLIHSADPSSPLKNLVSSLDNGGCLIIVDDMPVDRVAAADAGVLADFKRAWRCPLALSASGWTTLAQSAGLRLLEERDLSHLLKPRQEADLDAALDDLSAQRAEKAENGFGRLSDAEIGGLHLERLLRRGTVRYVMLVFET
jgi:SAM-dependent methyltransferase